jgi:hypothetical protein
MEMARITMAANNREVVVMTDSCLWYRLFIA